MASAARATTASAARATTASAARARTRRAANATTRERRRRGTSTTTTTTTARALSARTSDDAEAAGVIDPYRHAQGACEVRPKRARATRSRGGGATRRDATGD
jgi:hypothetical protein